MGRIHHTAEPVSHTNGTCHHFLCALTLKSGATSCWMSACNPWFLYHLTLATWLLLSPRYFHWKLAWYRRLHPGLKSKPLNAQGMLVLRLATSHQRASHTRDLLQTFISVTGQLSLFSTSHPPCAFSLKQNILHMHNHDSCNPTHFCCISSVLEEPVSLQYDGL